MKEPPLYLLFLFMKTLKKENKQVQFKKSDYCVSSAIVKEGIFLINSSKKIITKVDRNIWG